MIRILTALLTVILWGAWPPPAAGADGCSVCHAKAPETQTTAHTYADWKISVHGKAGIGCQACHGGDAAAAAMAAAHRGMRPSVDSDSAVYFTRIPETCGACHAAEFSAFKKSRHASELARTGKGPNCVTCHGSMASRIIEARDMEMTCTLCHRKPTKAHAARAAVDEARAALHKFDERLQKARAAGTIDLKVYEAAYKGYLAGYQALQVDWHSFDMVAIHARAKDLAKKISASHTELTLRDRRP